MRYTGQNGSAEFAAKVVNAEAEKAKEEKKKHRGRVTGAHTTMPIKDMDMVRKWIAIAKEHDKNTRGGVSWYLLVVLGFNTGLRISDIIKLTVRDIRDVERIVVNENKTKKEQDLVIPDDVRRTINKLTKGKSLDDYVLHSRQREKQTGKQKAITRQRAYAIVQEIAEKAGYKGHTGCHTMRKTYAWQYYEASKRDLVYLQKRLNHSSQEATLHYLGLDRDAQDEVSKKVVSMI